MDTGNLAHSLVSNFIVTGVINAVAGCEDDSSYDNHCLLNEGVEEYGFFGPNPLEVEDENFEF